jgi:hypothetical protein
LDAVGDAGEALRRYAMVHTRAFKEWFGDWEGLVLGTPHRPDANGNENIAAIHRYFSPVATPEGMLTAKITVKEFAFKSAGNRLYSVEAFENGEARRGLGGLHFRRSAELHPPNGLQGEATSESRGGQLSLPVPRRQRRAAGGVAFLSSGERITRFRLSSEGRGSRSH